MMKQLKQAFEISWRVAILLLPWQVRWIFSVPTIGGFPWEQGTVAMYISWIPVILAIGAGMGVKIATRSKGAGLKPAPTSIAILALVVVSFTTAAPVATILWWLHITLLVAFGWVLWKHRVSQTQLATWIVLSVIPHAVLGIVQFFQQHIYASSWFGIAEQVAAKPGVSVVEYGEYRILRAYGGFPHPNILGGWIAAALALLPALARDTDASLKKWIWMAAAFVLSVTLVLTFSRSAWIAAVVGLIAGAVIAFRSSSRAQREPIIVVCVLVIAGAGFMGALEMDTVTARVRADARLEQLSVDQRATSLRDGGEAWLQRPVFGWGPGAALVGMHSLGHEGPSIPLVLPDGTIVGSVPIPLEPPHTGPLVILLEIGIIGALAVLALSLMLLFHLFRSRTLIAVIPVLATLAILAGLDHYFWTLWAGQMLFGLLLLTCFLPSFRERSVA